MVCGGVAAGGVMRELALDIGEQATTLSALHRQSMMGLSDAELEQLRAPSAQ